MTLYLWSYSRGIESRSPAICGSVHTPRRLARLPRAGDDRSRGLDLREPAESSPRCCAACWPTEQAFSSKWPRTGKSGSQWTRRWREMDSNFRFRARRNREILVSRWSSLILYGFARPRGSARSPHVWRSSKMPTHGRDTELVEVYGQALPTGGGRSRNRHPAVHRIHMPGDHP
jgi:hypothetical protein